LKYYIITETDEQRGPFRLEELADAGVTPDTYVWCKGMKTWKQAADVPDICRYWRNRLYNLQHPDLPAKGIPEELQRQQSPGVTRFQKYGIEMPDPAGIKTDINIKPADTLWPSILVTILCSWLGLVAIYYSWQTNKNWNLGNHELAHEQSRKAKIWLGISFFSSFIIMAVLIGRTI